MAIKKKDYKYLVKWFTEHKDALCKEEDIDVFVQTILDVIGIDLPESVERAF